MTAHVLNVENSHEKSGVKEGAAVLKSPGVHSHEAWKLQRKNMADDNAWRCCLLVSPTSYYPTSKHFFPCLQGLGSSTKPNICYDCWSIQNVSAFCRSTDLIWSSWLYPNSIISSECTSIRYLCALRRLRIILKPVICSTLSFWAIQQHVMNIL